MEASTAAALIWVFIAATGLVAAPSWVNLSGGGATRLTGPSLAVYSDFSLDYASKGFTSIGSEMSLSYLNKIDGVTLDIKATHFRYDTRYQNIDETFHLHSDFMTCAIGSEFSLGTISWKPAVEIVSDDRRQLLLPQFAILWPIESNFGIGAFTRSKTHVVSFAYDQTQEDVANDYDYLPIWQSYGVRFLGKYLDFDFAVEGGKARLTSTGQVSVLNIAAEGDDWQAMLRSPKFAIGQFQLNGAYLYLTEGSGDLRNRDGNLMGALNFDSIGLQRLSFDHQLHGWRWGLETMNLDTRQIAAESVSTLGGSWANLIGRQFYQCDQILYVNQRINVHLTPDEYSVVRLSLGRLALTGNIKQYSMPLFFIMYSGTSALDISELDYIEMELRRRFLITNQLDLELGISQLIPVRVVKSSVKNADNTGNDQPIQSGGGTPTSIDSWGGLFISVQVGYRLYAPGDPSKK